MSLLRTRVNYPCCLKNCQSPTDPDVLRGTLAAALSRLSPGEFKQFLRGERITVDFESKYLDNRLELLIATSSGTFSVLGFDDEADDSELNLDEDDVFLTLGYLSKGIISGNTYEIIRSSIGRSFGKHYLEVLQKVYDRKDAVDAKSAFMAVRQMCGIKTASVDDDDDDDSDGGSNSSNAGGSGVNGTNHANSSGSNGNFSHQVESDNQINSTYASEETRKAIIQQYRYNTELMEATITQLCAAQQYELVDACARALAKNTLKELGFILQSFGSDEWPNKTEYDRLSYMLQVLGYDPNRIKAALHALSKDEEQSAAKKPANQDTAGRPGSAAFKSDNANKDSKNPDKKGDKGRNKDDNKKPPKNNALSQPQSTPQPQPIQPGSASQQSTPSSTSNADPGANNGGFCADAVAQKSEMPVWTVLSSLDGIRAQSVDAANEIQIKLTEALASGATAMDVESLNQILAKYGARGRFCLENRA